MSTPVDVTAVTNQVYSQIASMVGNRSIDPTLLMEICVESMEILQQMQAVPAATKKAVVLAVLNNILTQFQSKIPADILPALQFAVNSVFPSVIDAIVNAANGGTSLGDKIIEDVVGSGCCSLSSQPAPIAPSPSPSPSTPSSASKNKARKN